MSTDPADRLRPLRQTRQVREFMDEPVDRAALDAIADVAGWSGSSSNSQPWRFIVVPGDERTVSRAYDEGRAAERILIAASMLDLGAGIAWILSGIRADVGEIFGLPADRMIRTVVSLGHPSAGARQPKAPPGKARLPREDTLFYERWPTS